MVTVKDLADERGCTVEEVVAELAFAASYVEGDYRLSPEHEAAAVEGLEQSERDETVSEDVMEKLRALRR